jgi:crotonobetainyl-CoA:carnitine CoA-transferase CaiB-like acyl-CoA transferase
MMSLNGEAERDPVRVGFTVVDILAAQTLTSGVLAALLRRGTTGRGGLVDLSLIDVAVTALANAWAEYGLQGNMPLRRGNGQPLSAPAADVINTRDGQVVISAYTEEHFGRLCETIGCPELAMDPRFSTNQARVAHRSEMMTLLQQALSKFEADQLVDLLSQGGIVAGKIRTMDQVQPGQAGVSNDLFVKVTAAQRAALDVPGQPIIMAGIRRSATRLPALGEHTDEVLAEWATPQFE